MAHKNQASGSLAQAPAPSVETTTIISPCWTAAKKPKQNPAHQYKTTQKDITLYT